MFIFATIEAEYIICTQKVFGVYYIWYFRVRYSEIQLTLSFTKEVLQNGFHSDRCGGSAAALQFINKRPERFRCQLETFKDQCKKKKVEYKCQKVLF